MLYYKNSSGGILGDYYLNFNSTSSQYLQNDVSTPFTQWDKAQAWTCFIKTRDILSPVFSFGGAMFSWINGANTGLLIENIVGGTTGFRVWMNGFNTGDIIPLVLGSKIIQITYSGSGNQTGITIYVDNILVRAYSSSRSISGSLINGTNSVIVGARRVTTSGDYLNGGLERISFVNYVQNGTERSNDFANGFQTPASGSFLFNLPLIYPTNIISRDTTIPINESVQSLNMDYFGYPNPLIINNNLISI